MLSIISPAKTQDFTSQIVGLLPSAQPHFLTKTQYLLQICKNLSQNQIKQLMGVSDKLAELNYHRFQDFDNQPEKQAIFAYDGDVYHNMDRQNFTGEQWDFLQGHTLIISGLYGTLRVFDKIKPYRLEMSTKLPNFEKLSIFWQDDITNYVNQILATHQNKYLINLASNEYSCVINQNDLKYPIINIYFKEKRNNKLQIIAINSKKARGSMLNFIAENLIDLPEKLKHFSKQNYQYSKTESSNKDWIFIKNE